jgi:glutamate-1-semialdehyde aminotransferase
MAETAPLYDTYMRAPLRFERGEGVWLITESGERYLDFGAGVAVSSLGHGHPHLVGALKEQADKVWHLSNLYEVPGQETLGKRLTEATFADKVFFTNSDASTSSPSKVHFTAGRLRRSPLAARRSISKASAPRHPVSIRCRSVISRPCVRRFQKQRRRS